MSLAMPVREKGKGKAMPPWWQEGWPQIPAEYLRDTGTVEEEHDPQALPPYWWTVEPRSEGFEDSESERSERLRNPWGVDSGDQPTMFELYGYDADELPTQREMGFDLDSDSPHLDDEDPWHPEVLQEEARRRGAH